MGRSDDEEQGPQPGISLTPGLSFFDVVKLFYEHGRGRVSPVIGIIERHVKYGGRRATGRD